MPSPRPAESGRWGAKNNQSTAGGQSVPVAAPVPPAGSLPVPPIPAVGGGDPLLKTVQNIVQADANVTADEIAKALGINQKQAQNLLSAATVQPGGQQAPTPTAPLPVPPASPQPVPPVAVQPPAPQPPPGPQPPPTPPPVQGQTPPPAPPPVQGQQPQPQGADAERGVQQAVSAIAGLASQGGPFGAAAGRAVTAAASIPGIGATLAEAAPGLAASGPLLAGVAAAAAAGLAVPTAGALVANSIANQISGLSPEVAGAEAMASVRQLLANQRTAAQLGGEVGEFINQRSRLSTELQQTRDVIAEPLIRELTDSIKTLTEIVKLVNSVMSNNKELVQMIEAGVLGAMSPGLAALAAVAKFIKKKEEDALKANPLLNIFPPRPKLPAKYGFTENRFLHTQASSSAGCHFEIPIALPMALAPSPQL
jgi:outer membrane biosynthesis protein TonB